MARDEAVRELAHGHVQHGKTRHVALNALAVQPNVGAGDDEHVVALERRAELGAFVITEPVGGSKTNTSAADGDVWAEMVGIDMPGQANSVARDVVQLYR